jgi:hypothetical protein
MKSFQTFKSTVMLITIFGLLTLGSSPVIAARDTTSTGTKKGVVVLKIKKNDKGKTTVIDTSFIISSPSGQKELEEYLQKNEKDLENLSEELENLEVLVDVPDFPDSIADDSLVKHLRYACKRMRSPHFRWQNRDGGFDYDFELPCSHDFPPLREYEDQGNMNWPYNDMKIFRYDKDGRTLSDVIGDIPMDRVKSYSVKSKKNGKRIIVEIDNSPIMERQEKVIIIHEPGDQLNNKNKHERQKKVIIRTDDDRKSE